MIDLEDALAPLVRNAPEPPDVESVTHRGRQRRLRRRVALVTTVAVVAGGIGSAMAIASARHTKVTVVAPPTDTVRLTLLDGSQLEISGPSSLGLTRLEPVFHAELDPLLSTVFRHGHSFSVQRNAPPETGAIVGSYPTADGHELVLHETDIGVDAVVRYGAWTLVVSWNHDPTDWAAFAKALNAKETADGFLVIEPDSWRLAPTDSPDVQLGGAWAFFGPTTYRSGCEGPVPEPQWRCDAAARVRISALDPTFADALDEIKVSFSPATQAVAHVTTLDGQQLEITAPTQVLDSLILQATVAIDGVDTPTPIVVEARRESTPGDRTVGPTNYATGDGQQLFVTHFPSGDDALEANYGDWTVDIIVTGASDADRAQIASLFSARETSDGFLVLDPRAPMHLTAGPVDAVVLHGVDIVTSNGQPRVINRDRNSVDDVHVRRVG